MENLEKFKKILEESGFPRKSWKLLVDNPEVGLTWTPKAHYISDHFSDYFEDPLVEGMGLGVTTDQIIEDINTSIDY